jgi:hypothetical protein
VLANFCRDEAGCYMGHTGGRTMFEIPNTLWQRFVAAGVIRHDEYVRMTLSTYYRTVEECTPPLTDPGSPVYRTGLRLEQYETRVVPCPLAAAFRHHGDATRFAHEYIPSLRSWSESTFLAALSAGSTARAAPEDC